MEPKGKAPAPTPPYRQDAQKGYLPSVPFPHAGPEPSGHAPRSFLKGNSLELLAGRVKASNSSDFLIEVVVSDVSRSSLVHRRQLDKVHGGTWCDGVVRIGSGQFSESIVLLELDYKVLCLMCSAPISFVPKSSGTS